MAARKASIAWQSYRMAYRCIVRLHPHAFRDQFGEEMMWTFEQAVETHGAFRLLGDGLVSLTRQWVFRPRSWGVAMTEAVRSRSGEMGLFAWEHMNASPARLPAWGWLQGSMISLALFAGVWLAATQSVKRVPIASFGTESGSAMHTRGLTASASEDVGPDSVFGGAHGSGVYAGAAPREPREQQRRQQQLAVQVAAGARVIPGAPFAVVGSQGFVSEIPKTPAGGAIFPLVRAFHTGGP